MTPRQGFVLDASVVMAWCFGDEEAPYADAVLESLSAREAVAPSVWPLEVGNVLVAGERRGRLSAASAARFLTLLAGLPIRVVEDSPDILLSQVLALAREHGLSTYDASYLSCAMRLGLPLATLDARLAAAAGRCGVPVFDPAAKD